MEPAFTHPTKKKTATKKLLQPIGGSINTAIWHIFCACVYVRVLDCTNTAIHTCRQACVFLSCNWARCSVHTDSLTGSRSACLQAPTKHQTKNMFSGCAVYVYEALNTITCRLQSPLAWECTPICSILSLQVITACCLPVYVNRLIFLNPVTFSR